MRRPIRATLCLVSIGGAIWSSPGCSTDSLDLDASVGDGGEPVCTGGRRASNPIDEGGSNGSSGEGNAGGDTGAGGAGGESDQGMGGEAGDGAPGSSGGKGGSKSSGGSTGKGGTGSGGVSGGGSSGFSGGGVSGGGVGGGGTGGVSPCVSQCLTSKCATAAADLAAKCTGGACDTLQTCVSSSNCDAVDPSICYCGGTEATLLDCLVSQDPTVPQGPCKSQIEGLLVPSAVAVNLPQLIAGVLFDPANVVGAVFQHSMCETRCVKDCSGTGGSGGGGTGGGGTGGGTGGGGVSGAASGGTSGGSGQTCSQCLTDNCPSAEPALAAQCPGQTCASLRTCMDQAACAPGDGGVDVKQCYYCGTATPASCSGSDATLPLGPCKGEIEALLVPAFASSNSPQLLSPLLASYENPVGASLQYDYCALNFCASACGQ